MQRMSKQYTSFQHIRYACSVLSICLLLAMVDDFIVALCNIYLQQLYMSSSINANPLLIPDPLRVFWYPGERRSATTFPDMLSLSTMNFVGLIILSTVFTHASGVCAPFKYERDTPCAVNLAASAFTPCSTINMTLERSFCELQSINDLVHLESFVRVLGYKTVCMWPNTHT